VVSDEEVVGARGRGAIRAAIDVHLGAFGLGHHLERRARAAGDARLHAIEDGLEIGGVSLGVVRVPLSEHEDAGEAALALTLLAQPATRERVDHVDVDELFATDGIEVLLEEIDQRVRALRNVGCVAVAQLVGEIGRASCRERVS
jgi:hypothetical protein